MYLLVSGVYISSVYSYIHIYKKLPFLADFIKNWVHFIKKTQSFCSKTTKFSPKLAFLTIAGSFGNLLVAWLVVVARAVSRKTPIYFMILVCPPSKLLTLDINPESHMYMPILCQYAKCQ